ncbi:hypothetical protein [Arenibacter sp. ARW7G5Y1]|uniref:hypothetical protein n=1 Tax=Arenibacter sp. ARW7G5Y1 TaxID=2135619 RepID=UPI000D94FFE2|nr:hypothetical protein [Arenibacter sp. ARW7G5Y1]PXX22838.1 hypothetical protein C7972_12217 [Arenibacter sp. ARW7G5Y1]
MVRIINFKQYTSEEGKVFNVLELQGGIEMVKSQQTDRFYATARKATIPSTFDENTCKALIGTELAGKIVKVDTEPYDYTIPESGEVIELSHRYEYQPEEAPRPLVEKSNSTVEDFVKFDKLQEKFSSNGVM